MEYPEPGSLLNQSEVGGQGFRAVQGGTAITCVDWQAFHWWQDGDPEFTEVITVMDDHGGQQTIANWSSPTDADADTSLGNTGWQRVGAWSSDHNGRRSATVYRPPDRRRLRSSVALTPGATQQQSTYWQDPKAGPPDDKGLIVDGQHQPAWSAGGRSTEIEEVPMLPWPTFDDY